MAPVGLARGNLSVLVKSSLFLQRNFCSDREVIKGKAIGETREVLFMEEKVRERQARGKIKGIIFDLDGTLVDSEPNYYEADRRLFMEYGVREFTLEMKEKYIGVSSQDLIKDMKATHPIQATEEELLAKKIQYYRELAQENTPVFPEMKRFLDLLQQAGYPMAVASGSAKEVIELVLAVTDLTNYFQVLVSSDEVSKGKPAPDVFIEAAHRLQLPCENCLVLEDSQYGVEAAYRASMYCVGLPYSSNGEFPETFHKANLLLKRGVEEFSAERVFEWMVAL